MTPSDSNYSSNLKYYICTHSSGTKEPLGLRSTWFGLPVAKELEGSHVGSTWVLIPKYLLSSAGQMVTLVDWTQGTLAGARTARG